MERGGKVRDALFLSYSFSYIFKTTHTYLISRAIQIRMYESGIWDCPMPLLSVSFGRDSPQHIILLGPPNRDGVLWAPPILMPKLSYRASFLPRCHLVLIIKA